MSTLFIIVFILFFGFALYKIVKKKVKSNPPITYPKSTPGYDYNCKNYKIAVSDKTKEIGTILCMDCNNVEKVVDAIDGTTFCCSSVGQYDKSNIFLIDQGYCNN